MIPVRNVYYMLAYAFKALRGEGYADLATEPFDNVADLLAVILSRGVEYQARRGLARVYERREESLGSVRGKVEVGETVRTGALTRRRIVCSHDELSVDAYLNRVLKTACMLLLGEGIAHAREVRRSLRYLAGVTPLDPRYIEWRQRYDRSTATYRMLMSVSRMAIEGSLHSMDTGRMRLEEFMEEGEMSALYERFILEYFRREHSGSVDVSAPYIPWMLDGEEVGMLPVMRTDAVLRGRTDGADRTLVIDAKYYSENTQRRFGKRTIRSNHLYQMFAYVKNETARLATLGRAFEVSGLILYAKTDAAIQPEGSWCMGGNEIAVSALDLSADFEVISSQLDGIIERYFVNAF